MTRDRMILPPPGRLVTAAPEGGGHLRQREAAAGMRGLGELEAEIMSVVWRSARPLAVRDITEALNGTRSLAYSTVMTVTERLRHKGWLDRLKEGRAYRYNAARSADDYTADLMGQALDESRDRGSALVRFAGQLDAGDITTLREALERLPEESPPAQEK